MEDYIVKPSINMLPMQDIITSLNNEVLAKDTKTVHGTSSEEIAICSNKEDRTTIRNAEHLGNRPASEYLTIEADPTEAVDALANSHQAEITGLRLELYRLYEILNKQLGATYKPESGYLENFIDTITDATSAEVNNIGGAILDLFVDRADFAVEKEYIVIDDGENLTVTRIATIQGSNYTLEGSIPSLATQVTIYKIKGEMLKNAYSFSKTEKDLLSSHPHTVLLGDYSNTLLQTIDKGLATNMTLRSNMFAIEGERDKAVLDSVRVYIDRSSLESAPQLSCKIYTIDSPASEKPTLELIGASVAQDIIHSDWITFKLKNNGVPVEVLANQEILVAFECNGEHSYKIKMGKSQTGDLHTNRFIYMREEDNSYLKVVADSDIVLGLNFNSYVEEVTHVYRDGLYTSKTFINEKETNSTAQLQLKFRSISSTTIQSHEPVDAYNGFVISDFLPGNGKFVAGNNIGTFDRSSNNTIYSKEHFAVYPGELFYFIKFEAQIIASSELFANTTVKQVVEMLPVRVAGDYLIYECKLPEHTKHFNVQITYGGADNDERAAAIDSIIVSLT